MHHADDEQSRRLITAQEEQKLLAQATKDGVSKILVGAFVEREGLLLLLQRTPTEEWPNLVELPSGHVEEGESLLEALRRELLEETGLQLLDVGRHLEPFDYQTSAGTLARQFNFVVSAGDDEVTINPHEHARFFWISPRSAEFTGLNISSEMRDIINSAWLISHAAE